VHMPELDEWWGYPLALAVMAGVAGMLLYYLRSRHWI
jgi:Mg2+ and Co2+ transporter CorA